MAYIQQTLHPPTGVSLSCRAHLTAPRDSNVVVIKSNVLTVYRLSAAADQLLLVGEWCLSGVPTSVASTRPPGAETDALLVTFVPLGLVFGPARADWCAQQVCRRKSVRDAVRRVARGLEDGEVRAIGLADYSPLWCFIETTSRLCH